MEPGVGPVASHGRRLILVVASVGSLTCTGALHVTPLSAELTRKMPCPSEYTPYTVPGAMSVPEALRWSAATRTGKKMLAGLTPVGVA